MAHIKINVATGGIEHGTLTLPQLVSAAFGSGTSGQALVSNGGAADPSWATAAAGTTTTETSQSSSFAAAAGNSYVISGSSAVTATLATAVGVTGQSVRLRCAKGYTGLLTIATTSSQTLGPGTAITQILYAGETAVVQSDGANWARTGGTIIPAHARLSLSTPTSTAASTGVTAPLDTSDFDTSGQMNSTSGHTITCIRAGIYFITATAAWPSLDPTLGFVFITQAQKNGVQTLFDEKIVAASSGSPNYIAQISGSSILAVGDVITLLVYFAPSTGSTAINLGGGAFASTSPAFIEVTEIPRW